MSSTVPPAAGRIASPGTLLETVAAAATAAAARAEGAAVAAPAKKVALKKPADVLLDVLTSAAGPALGRALRDVLGAALRSAGVPGYAPRTSGSSSKNPLAFLSDPKLSIEQKLMRFLAYQNDEWEKQMNDKMKKLGGAQGSSTSSGGVLGGMAGALGKALKLPGAGVVLEKIGGPMLGAAATGLGLPALAPVLAKYGGKALGAVAGVAASLLDGASGAGGAQMKDSDKQLAIMEVQNLMQKQKEMFSLVSGILRSAHETRSAVIGNIR